MKTCLSIKQNCQKQPGQDDSGGGDIGLRVSTFGVGLCCCFTASRDSLMIKEDSVTRIRVFSTIVHLH